MYLKQLYIQHNGPINRLRLNLPFSSDGNPLPCVLVGTNGSGKTHLLSIVADALFEAAAVHYHDVVANETGMNRPWFRVVGGTTTTIGAPGGCVLLEFQEGASTHVYIEKGGKLSPSQVSEHLPESLRSHAKWAEDGAVKSFSIDEKLSQHVFSQGAYVYFPSNRSEVPHWLNQNSLNREDPRENLDLNPRITKKLGKPIYVESGLAQLKQWLLSLLLDIKVDVMQFQTNSQAPNASQLAASLLAPALTNRPLWESINHILQTVFGDPSVSFEWTGRHSSGRIVVQRNGIPALYSLDGLSAGQATLLNIFGTLLRYGDRPGTSQLVPSEIIGICIIDEIDAHMHMDLQSRALPMLIQMFPKVQFMLSSHSPFFVLGMEKVFGPDGLAIVDMPSGTPIHAEIYKEFEHALDALKNTRAFNAAITESAGVPGKILVLLEGETDPKYMSTAAELLGRNGIQEKVEFQWVGAKDPKSGQGFHTGKDALNTTLTVLRAKPGLAKRRIVLLYDNDANKPDEDICDFIHVRSMPTNIKNTVIEAGIENLLPETAIIPEAFDKKTTKKKNGSSTVTTTLNKMKLCMQLCDSKRDVSDFKNFSTILDSIEVLAAMATDTEFNPTDAQLINTA